MDNSSGGTKLNEDIDIFSTFTSAANHLALLYKQSINIKKQSYLKGYNDSLENILDFIKTNNIDSISLLLNYINKEKENLKETNISDHNNNNNSSNTKITKNINNNNNNDINKNNINNSGIYKIDNNKLEKTKILKKDIIVKNPFEKQNLNIQQNSVNPFTTSLHQTQNNNNNNNGEQQQVQQQQQQLINNKKRLLPKLYYLNGQNHNNINVYNTINSAQQQNNNTVNEIVFEQNEHHQMQDQPLDQHHQHQHQHQQQQQQPQQLLNQHIQEQEHQQSQIYHSFNRFNQNTTNISFSNIIPQPDLGQDFIGNNQLFKKYKQSSAISDQFMDPN
ncbi:hypothetical protein ACTFIY_012643 [Dictyostelium cf. discoideum]